ncbi:hypothetical protein HDU91_002935 [Kappamyces sp. JEL0680]|nr:hypothetical protein HDU91_002935 [Kappamyces sp. JEL0680]
MLSKELDESSNSTDLIRADIRNLKARSCIIPILKKCDVCTRPLMTRQFHVFPCQHTFHSDCLIDELLQYPVKNTKVKYLQNQLGVDPKARDELETLLGEECCLCGDIMIRTIDIELVSDPDIL